MYGCERTDKKTETGLYCGPVITAQRTSLEYRVEYK